MSHRKTVEDALVCFAEPSRRAAYFDLYSADVVLHGYGGVEPGLIGKLLAEEVCSAADHENVWLKRRIDKLILKPILFPGLAQNRTGVLFRGQNRRSSEGRADA